MIEGVIFDLDGVIISTDRLHCMAWADTCKEWEIPFSEEDNNLLRGVSRMECVEIILMNTNRLLSSEEKARFAYAKNERYVRLLAKLTKDDLMPNVSYVIRELSNQGIRSAIGSSSKNAKFILKKIGISDWFDAIIDGNMIYNSKPDPEVFIMAANALNLPSKNCLVVEDAESGILAAKAAGSLVAAIGFARSSGNADYVLSKLDELLEIINE